MKEEGIPGRMGGCRGGGGGLPWWARRLLGMGAGCWGGCPKVGGMRGERAAAGEGGRQPGKEKIGS